MTTVSELQATARPKSGKGAARAARRAGQVPGIIYGDRKDPLAISIDYAELRHKIYAGRFLTTLFDVVVDGERHRVIPRDFQLDPVRDNPLHVDFMRLGKGAKIRVSIPIHVSNQEVAPGIKRGGTVNLVTHSVDVLVDPEAIPPYLEVDIADLEIGVSKHLSDVKLPSGVNPISKADLTLVTIVPPSGYQEEMRQAAQAAAAPAAATTAGDKPAAGAAAAPAAGGDKAAAAKAPAAKAPAAKK